MSLFIRIDDVQEVLLADGWHKCDFTRKRTNSNNENDASSFDLDAYEFVEEYWNYDNRKSMVHHNGGTGFVFSEDGKYISGPISTLLAVKYIDRDPIPDPNFNRIIKGKEGNIPT